MHRTNIVINDELVAACKKATGIKTHRALVDYALREVLRHETQTKILKLKGNLDEWRQTRGI